MGHFDASSKVNTNLLQDELPNTVKSSSSI